MHEIEISTTVLRNNVVLFFIGNCPCDVETDEMKLTFPLLNTTINVPVDETMAGGKKSRRELRRKKLEGKQIQQIEKVEEPAPVVVEQKPVEKPVAESTAEGTQVAAEPVSDKDSAQPLLMVEVVNVTHEKFRQTEEVKVFKDFFITWTFIQTVFLVKNV